MTTALLDRTFLLASLMVVGVAFACGCTFESEGQLTPDASVGAGGGTGGTTGDGGPDQGTPDIGSPDVACFWPNKVCGNECVDFDDPDYGCAPETCEPCDSFPHAVVGCVNNKCEIVGCDTGWGNCDADPQNGCETNIHTVENCGECGEPCALPNAIETCAQGSCAIADCESDWDDCNHNSSDGCETYLRDIENCGSCGYVCSTTDGPPTCVQGYCAVDTCNTSSTGMADCDSNPADCETDVRTIANCGACGNTCGFAGDHVGSWQCSPAGSTWGCRVGTCDPNWGNCDSDDGTGCATNLLEAIHHCGQCGAPCSGINTLSQACLSGKCAPTCTNGYGDCNGPESGVSDDGCETATHSDVNNCGACGNACSFNQATETCQSGNCGIQSCDTGWDDCTTANGCETNIFTDPSNCGACGFQCDTTGGSPTCNGGSCNITCQAGRGNCDNDADTGCETDLTTISNCGACGNACSSENGTPSCVNQQCQIACYSGYADCDGKASTGCEISTNTNPNHCGACSQSCSNNHMSTRTCSNGACDGTCQLGYADCDNNKLSNGCEVNLNTDPANCNGCGQVCSDNHMATVTCDSGACSGTCEIGYSDCANGKRVDGCETNTSGDVNNCGGCGDACSTNHLQSVTCSSSVCSGTCESDWEDCDSDLQSTGCEVNTSGDVNNCGGCGDACSTNHVSSPSCSSGGCDGQCENGYEDCNGDMRTDGCETATGTVASCGGCSSCEELMGVAPSNTSWTCVSESCEPVCDGGWLACDGDVTNGCESPETRFDASCNCLESQCGANGTCDLGTGLCSCGGGGECQVGEWCIANNTCGTE